MKNVITLLMCTLCILKGMSQINSTGNQVVTPELKALYEQAKQLENTGTAAEINSNRLAIKYAWQEVDPRMAALYRPLTPIIAPTVVEGSYEESRSPEYWDTDKMVHEGIIDGFDMSVTIEGIIYISVIENDTNGDANLLVYRSTNNGGTFNLWRSFIIFDAELWKIETISIDGNGDDYLLAYMNTYYSFFAMKIKVATNDFEMQGISDDVIDFSVDRNYPEITSNQSVFATYIKEQNNITTLYSARSTAGSYGLDWVDETEIQTNIEGVAFAYGRDGGCYTTFVDSASGDLYATANPNYNDPGSWETNENVWSGTNAQLWSPTIRAARKAPADDHVLIGISSKPSYSEKFIYRSFVRKNSDDYTTIGAITPSNDGHYIYVNSWVRREDDVDIIRTSFVNIYNFENNRNYSRTYNGDDGFDWAHRVSDSGINVYSGARSIIAETSDHQPCMVFAGDKINGEYAENVYFDAMTETVNVEENNTDSVTVFPNPTEDVLNILAKSRIQKVAIFSQLGQEVMQFSPQQKSQSITISALATGIYTMKVEIDGQIGAYKIIKE